MATVSSSDGQYGYVKIIRGCASCEEIRVANQTIHLVHPRVVVRLAPSSGNQFFYLIVERRIDDRDTILDTGEKVWPRAREEAIGAWYARVCGYTTLVKKTPDGERHISLPES